MLFIQFKTEKAFWIYLKEMFWTLCLILTQNRNETKYPKLKYTFKICSTFFYGKAFMKLKGKGKPKKFIPLQDKPKSYVNPNTNVGLFGSENSITDLLSSLQAFGKFLILSWHWNSDENIPWNSIINYPVTNCYRNLAPFFSKWAV